MVELVLRGLERSGAAVSIVLVVEDSSTKGEAASSYARALPLMMCKVLHSRIDGCVRYPVSRSLIPQEPQTSGASLVLHLNTPSTTNHKTKTVEPNNAITQCHASFLSIHHAFRHTAMEIRKHGIPNRGTDLILPIPRCLRASAD